MAGELPANNSTEDGADSVPARPAQQTTRGQLNPAFAVVPVVRATCTLVEEVLPGDVGVVFVFV